jgi:hypothetical protein
MHISKLYSLDYIFQNFKYISYKELIHFIWINYLLYCNMTTTTGIYNQSAKKSNYKKRILIVDDNDEPDIAKSEDRFRM